MLEIEYFNKIKYDPTITNKFDHDVYYQDRFRNNLIKVNWFDIIDWDKFSFRINDMKAECIKEIPFHRVRKIMLKDKIVWERVVAR